MSNESDIKKRRTKALNTPSPLGTDAARDIAGELKALLADILALYMKTKNSILPRLQRRLVKIRVYTRYCP